MAVDTADDNIDDVVVASARTLLDSIASTRAEIQGRAKARTAVPLLDDREVRKRKRGTVGDGGDGVRMSGHAKSRGDDLRRRRRHR